MVKPSKNKIGEKTSLKWLIEHSKGERGRMWLLIISNAIFSVLSIAFAFAIKIILDGAQNGVKDKIIFGSVLIFGIVVFQFVFRIIINFLVEIIRGRLEISLKSYIFEKILCKKYDNIKNYHSGELLNRLTSDVSVVSDGITTIVPTVVASVVRLVCAVVALVLLDWIFAVAFLIAGALVFTVINLLRGKLKSLHKMSQETDGKVRSFMQECLENILAIKVFSVNKKIEKHAGELQQENYKVKMRRKNYSVIGSSTYNFIFSAGYLFALIYGAVKIFTVPAVFTYGSLSAILQLVNNVQVPFASLSSVFPKYYSMTASAERLMEIENLADESVEKLKDPTELYSKFLSIRADKVVFSYDRDVVLGGASMEINKGDRVAITGASGIGKSTLLKLILGVYSPESGGIYIDCVDESFAVDCSSRSLFSYVPQGNMLFSGTLKDNVTFINGGADDAEIERALALSCVKDFLNELPDGLETRVGENGIGLSEGQIQRVAIARAVLCDSPIILLDEATSALDADTEMRVLENLTSLKDKSLVIISHRKAALSYCNKELRIKDGKISTVELTD